MMSTFQSWALSRVRGEEDDDDLPSVRVTLRLDPGDYIQIQECAKRLDVTKTRLMQQMVSDSLNDLRLIFSMMDDGDAEQARQEADQAYMNEEQDRLDAETAYHQSLVKEAA